MERKYQDLETPLVETGGGSRSPNAYINNTNKLLLGVNVVTLVAVIVFGAHGWSALSNDVSSPTRSSSGTYSNAPCASLCAPVCLNQDPKCYPTCYATCDKGQNSEMKRPAVLGDWLMLNAIQHVGITTSNLTRSVKFYTEVLGGVEVKNAGGDGWKSTPVYYLLMQQALLGGPATAKWAANLTEAGPDVLNARYVSFGSLVIEFLAYKADEVKLQEQMLQNPQGPPDSSEPPPRYTPTPSPPGIFPTWSDSNVAPSVAGNMHVSFNVRTSVSLLDFVTQLETSAHGLGYNNVWCNRLVPVKSRKEYKALPSSDNAFFVKTGGFEGWSLAYCKGPDGEQLEFNQVKDFAKVDFDQAQAVYVEGGTNNFW